MLGHAQTGFVVLPDNDMVLGVAERLHPWGRCLATYPSGRPWVVGNCWDRPVVTAEGSTVRAAILGYTSITAERLKRQAGTTGEVSQWEHLLGDADGCFHSALLISDQVHIRGSTYGVCRLYTCTVGGATLVSDSAHALRVLTRAEADITALACHLLEPVPYWLGEQPLLVGVTPVPPTHHLIMTPDGVCRGQPSRWLHHEPTLGLREGAEQVRARLSAAVAIRTAAGGVITSEMSGGYDSTSISYLATSGPASTVLLTADSRDSTSEDITWARRAATGLPGVEHIVLPPAELPFMYAGLHSAGARLDEPSIAVPGRERVLTLVRRAAARGSRLHLTGHGGDHLFTSVPTPYHDMMRSHPVTALRQLRAFGSLAAWPRGELLREIADRRDYRTWWRAHAQPRVGQPDVHAPMLGWAVPPYLPSWIGADGVHAIHGRLVELAENSQPLGLARGEHAELDSIFEGVRMVRALNQLATSAGVPLAAPFFDDKVVDACLSVRPHERISAWRYKPLLHAAMQDIVPDSVLSRSSKDDGSIDVAYGLDKHRDELVALWEDSRLAEVGLVDAGLLRRLCAHPSSPELEQGALYSTIACELWLRGLEEDKRNERRKG